MDLQRVFLIMIFSFSGFLLWNSSSTKSTLDINTLKQPASSHQAVLPPKFETINVDRIEDQNNLISVLTDVYSISINRKGGDIQKVELLKHKSVEDKNKPFALLQNSPSKIYVTQSGFLGENLPDHHFLYHTDFNQYLLSENADAIKVVLNAGSNIKKIYTFHRSSYVIDIEYQIENNGLSPINSSAYFQIVSDGTPPLGGSKMVPTYTGAAIYTEQEKFQKIDFKNIEEQKTNFVKESNNGWIAMLQHYFVSAWIPENNLHRENYTKYLSNNLYAIGTIVPIKTIAPGKTETVKTKLYVGPASINLNDVAPGLGLTVDYGWLTIIASPLFWLLAFIQSIVINWGVAIILLTLLIKLVFFPLSAASYKSMAKMKVVAPKLEKIKQQYGEDREKLNRAMMDLYKTEKINPLGGCLPVLIQIPVFISLYWAILSSVELRNAPFFAWITDLSTADPYFVLPAIMGISMFIQGRLNPKPPDPLQAKLMQLMPVVFSVVFFFFPAGLVLYSIVNNVLSILQQWYITRGLENENVVTAKN